MKYTFVFSRTDLTISCVQDTSPSDTSASIVLRDPLGVIYTPVNGAITLPSPGSAYNGGSAPLDANGALLSGFYEATITESSVSVPSSNTTFKISFPVREYIALNGGVTAAIAANAFTGEVKLIDTSNYNVDAYSPLPTVTRSLDLELRRDPVAGATDQQIADVGLEVDLISAFNNVGFTGTISGSVETSVTVSGHTILVTEEYNVTLRYQFMVRNDVCSLIACLHDQFAHWQADATRYGGYQFLPAKDYDKMLRITAILALYNNAAACNREAFLQLLFAELQGLLDCKCGCEEAAPTGPVPFTPFGSPGVTFNVIAGNGIVVASNNGTFTVSISQSYIDAIIADAATVVEGSQFILSTPIAGGYRISQTSPAWVNIAANTIQAPYSITSLVHKPAGFQLARYRRLFNAVEVQIWFKAETTSAGSLLFVTGRSPFEVDPSTGISYALQRGHRLMPILGMAANDVVGVAEVIDTVGAGNPNDYNIAIRFRSPFQARETYYIHAFIPID